MNIYKKTLSLILSLLLPLVIFVGQSMEYVNAQLNESYCMGKKDEMMSRGYEWSEQGSTATTDPNGLIRSDGKQLSSEIEPTVVNCEPYLTAEHLLALTEECN